MVSSKGFTWNSLYTSLVQMDAKLQELGLIEVGGKIVLIEEEEVENA